MKKIVLASLLGAFAITGANAADGYTHNPEHWRVRMDSNPLYRPLEGRFYSITNLDTDTDFDFYSLGEEIGLGISDRWSIFINTAGSLDTNYEEDSLEYANRDKVNWDNLGLGTSFRYVDRGPWIADLYGKVRQDYAKDVEVTEYNWTVGTTFGYVGWDRWTLAFTVQADYIDDSLGAIDYDGWGMRLGVDGLYNFNQHWNVVAGLYYDFNLGDDSEYYPGNPLTVKLGFDYNFTDWTYIGIYATKDVKSDFDENPMGLGIKFGIDF